MFLKAAVEYYSHSITPPPEVPTLKRLFLAPKAYFLGEYFLISIQWPITRGYHHRQSFRRYLNHPSWLRLSNWKTGHRAPLGQFLGCSFLSIWVSRNESQIECQIYQCPFQRRSSPQRHRYALAWSHFESVVVCRNQNPHGTPLR